MPGFLIKNLPSDLHARLKEQAERNHRSMGQQVLEILEQGLQEDQAVEFPKPFKASRTLTQRQLTRAIREKRA